MITWYWLYRFSVSRGHISKPSVSDTRTEQNPCMTLISTLHICPFDSALCSFTIMNSPKMWNRYLYICIHGVWFLWCFAMIFNDIYMIYIYTTVLQSVHICCQPHQPITVVLCNGGPVDVCNHELRGPGTNIKGGSASQLRHGAATIRAEMWNVKWNDKCAK